MSDQWPRWSPPGDATSEGQRVVDADGGARPQPPPATGGDEPPPPPPPPEATAPTYGHGDWEPPTRPRRTGLIVAVVVAIVVIPLVLGGMALLAVRDGGMPTAEQGGGAEATQAPSPAPPGDPVAQSEAVLQAIDMAEERMIAFQQEVFEATGEDGSVGGAAEEVAQAAQVAGNDLTELRSELRGMAEEGEGETFEALREVRDGYAEHMSAWIDYVDAVAGSPALASPQSGEAEAFWEEINVTGEVFVEAVENLPEDLPDRVLDLADMIVERGFSSSGQPSGNLV